MKKRRRIRFEVLPDGGGLWAVTRDRVVVGVFERKAEAVDYAAARGLRQLGGWPPGAALHQGPGRQDSGRTHLRPRSAAYPGLKLRLFLLTRRAGGGILTLPATHVPRPSSPVGCKAIRTCGPGEGSPGCRSRGMLNG